MHRIVVALLCTGLVLPAVAGLATAGDEDFTRERRDNKPERNRAADALEGKAPPPLQVSDWRNTGGQALDWAALRGKVVVIDFWGTW